MILNPYSLQMRDKSDEELDRLIMNKLLNNEFKDAIEHEIELRKTINRKILNLDNEQLLSFIRMRKEYYSFDNHPYELIAGEKEAERRSYISINPITQNANENNSTNITEINKDKLVGAGKALKNIAYTNMIMITIAVFALPIVSSSRDIETIKNTYIFGGLLYLICSIIILFQFYSAGDNLENSMYKK